MALDRITAITDGVDAAQTQQYQYDALSRLVRSEHAGGNVASDGYDAVGNRVSLGNTCRRARRATPTPPAATGCCRRPRAA